MERTGGRGRGEEVRCTPVFAVSWPLMAVRGVGAPQVGTSVYTRDPDGNLLEFIVYDGGSAARQANARL